MVPITLLALGALRPDVCPAPSAFHRLRGGARDHDPEDDASATMAEEIKKLKDSSGAGSLLESLESLKRLKALLESREPPQPPACSAARGPAAAPWPAAAHAT